jgi:hypothetical protein
MSSPIGSGGLSPYGMGPEKQRRADIDVQWQTKILDRLITKLLSRYKRKACEYSHKKYDIG